MVDLKADPAADNQLATTSSDNLRLATGKLPHQASLFLTLTGVVSSGSSSSIISGAIISIDGAATTTTTTTDNEQQQQIVVDSE